VFGNYLKVAFRTIRRRKAYSLINIAGLAVGMACCILILLWVQNEMSYDAFHEKADDLFCVCKTELYGERLTFSLQSPPALGPALKADYPEIVNTARLAFRGNLPVRYGEKCFTATIKAADPALLDMFSFPLVKGNPHTALIGPHSLVITERVAEKYFKDEEPLGKTLILDNQYAFTVTGVAKNVPANSSVQFDLLAPLEIFRDMQANYLDTWYNCSFYTYAQLQPGADYHEVSGKIAGRVKASREESTIEPFLFPLTDMHLHSIDGHGGQIILVYVFSAIALLILLVACINFMNLATACAGARAKEVGMRKVIGARRSEIARQFLGESLLLSGLSMGLAIILVELFLPLFCTLTGQPIRLGYWGNPAVLLGLPAIALLTGLVAGSYPALFLSSIKPARILKGILRVGSTRSWLRRGLVVAQFTFSIILIIGTSVVYSQHGFMQNKDLGLDREHLLYIPLAGDLREHHESVKQELLHNPNIQHVTLSSGVPTGVYFNGTGFDWDGRSPNVDPLVTYLMVDCDFAATFGVQMAEGEFYSPGARDDGSQLIVINETFARIMGEASPIGRRLSIDDLDFTIIGVVRDFHYMPVSSPIGPLIVTMYPEWLKYYNYMFARISAEDVPGTIAYIDEVHKKFNPDVPLDYHFLDQDYEHLYYRELRAGKIIAAFSIIAIFISCLGLFGLASFMAENRSKEIGIRKVLGASVSGVVALLSREFAMLTLVATALAWPVAYYAMNGWLQSFAYRTDLHAGFFIGSAALTLVIVLFSVGYQAIHAALTDPVKAIKYE